MIQKNINSFLAFILFVSVQPTFAEKYENFKITNEDGSYCLLSMTWGKPEGKVKWNCPKTSATKEAFILNERTWELKALEKMGNQNSKGWEIEYSNSLSRVFEEADKTTGVECHFVFPMSTACRGVAKGTRIKRRGYASEAFKSNTGFVLCSDSVAGMGGCQNLKKISSNK